MHTIMKRFRYCSCDCSDFHRDIDVGARWAGLIILEADDHSTFVQTNLEFAVVLRR